MALSIIFSTLLLNAKAQELESFFTELDSNKFENVFAPFGEGIRSVENAKRPNSHDIDLKSILGNLPTKQDQGFKSTFGETAKLLDILDLKSILGQLPADQDATRGIVRPDPHEIDLKSIFGNEQDNLQGVISLFEAMKPAILESEVGILGENGNVHSFGSSSTQTGCTEGFIPNASYFQAHPDPARPCYTHICYPKDDSPFYFWEERFLADKCCKYRGNEIVYGTEVLLESDDQCSEEIVRCEVPQNDPDAPLIPVHETGKSTCCKYNAMNVRPGSPVVDFDSCGQISCVFTQDGVELRHEVVHEEGCCDIDGKMVGEGQIYNDMQDDQSYLCYKGNPYKVIIGNQGAKTKKKPGPVQQPSDSVLPSQAQTQNEKGPSVIEDLALRPVEKPTQNATSSPQDGCASCYANNLEHGYFGQMTSALQKLMAEKPIKKVSFLINGNNAEHKMAASILATKMDLMNENRLAYLTYYAYHEDGNACTIYKWDDQCSTNKCGFAQKLMGTDKVEDHQKISSGSLASFENAADLAFDSSSTISSNYNLPFCPSPNANVNHDETLILFFASYEGQQITFPHSILDHVKSGCNVAIVTFDWSHFFEAEKFASQDSSGKPLAFRVETHGLGQFTKCQLDCSCPGFNAAEGGDHRSLLPAFIDTCAVTVFKRASTNDATQEMDMKCSDFEDQRLMEIKAEPGTLDVADMIGHSFDSPALTDLVTQFNGIMDNGQRHGYHEDVGTMDNCLSKYGKSFQSILYCVHVLTTQQRQKRDLSDLLKDGKEDYDNESVDDILDIDFSRHNGNNERKKPHDLENPYFEIDG